MTHVIFVSRYFPLLFWWWKRENGRVIKGPGYWDVNGVRPPVGNKISSRLIVPGW